MASAFASRYASSAACASGRQSARRRASQALSWNTRPFAPNRISCATVGALMRPSGSPRYSRSSSGSGMRTSLIMWLVAKPSIALATGMSDSALTL